MAVVLFLMLLLILPGAAAWQFVETRGGIWLVIPLTVAGLSFVAYAVDKRRARRGGERTPEATLLAIDLLGGWPGGFVAQQVLRHKTAKATYQFAFWLIVAAYQTVAAWWLFG